MTQPRNDKPRGNGSGNGSGAQTDTDSDSREFLLQQIYVKDFSFEVPNAPAIYSGEQNPDPDVSLNISSGHRALGNDHHEVVLELTVNARLGDRTMFLLEIQQAGVFSVRGCNDEELRRLLGIHCPTTLFPYAREAISSAVSRGGFPPLILQPINFESLYLQAQAGQAAAQA